MLAGLVPTSAAARWAASASVRRSCWCGYTVAGSGVRRRDRHDRRALDVLVPDLPDLERLDVLAQLLEGLLEWRQRLALARERRGAGEHVVLHVRVIDAALLDLRYGDGEHLVDRPHEARA